MPTQIISSESNDKIKVFKSLLTSKGVKENNKFILSGMKIIEEFFGQNLARFKIHGLIFDSEQWPAFLEEQENVQKYIIPKNIFKELDVIGTKEPLLVLEFKDFDQKDLSASAIDLEIICPLGDPRNLGALIRSAVGFGVREIILTKEAAHPFLPQSVKASAGAVLYATFKKTDLAVSEISFESETLALDLKGQNLSGLQFPKNFRLLVGEEGPGLQLTAEQKNKIKYINIPTQRIESLNAMVSTSLALWEWKKQN